MLNYEYARLVEQDRRREIAERIRIARVLHQDDPGDGSADDGRRGAGRGLPAARSAPTPAR